MNEILSITVIAALAFAFVTACVRAIIGPTQADRIVALDILTLIGIGAAAAAAVLSGKGMLLDAAAVLALLSFLGTVAFSLYLEKRSSK